MNRLKQIGIGAIATINWLMCPLIVQASPIELGRNEFLLMQQEEACTKREITIEPADLTGEIVALEIELELMGAHAIEQIQSKIADGYFTYQWQPLGEDTKQLNLYLISETSNVPLVFPREGQALIEMQLLGDEKFQIKSEKTKVKVIEKGYHLSEDIGTDSRVRIKLLNEEVEEEETKPSQPDQDTVGGNGGNGNQITPPSNGNTSSSHKNDKTYMSGSSSKGPTVTDQEDKSEEASEKVHFTDLDKHWAKTAILNMVEKGIIKGYEDHTFRPNASITRGEFATLLARAFKIEAKNGQSPFDDVIQGKWYTDGILALYEAGITSGKAKGKFGVYDLITNEEMATMLNRTIKYIGAEMRESGVESVTFTDQSQISGYAQEAVLFLSQRGIIKGNPDGSYGPKHSATRAQVAVLLERLFNRVTI